jgi:hypothetical protein
MVLHRTPPNEDDEHHLQKPIRPRLHLHAAGGWVPNKANTMYTPANKVPHPPTAGAADGGRGTGNSPTTRWILFELVDYYISKIHFVGVVGIGFRMTYSVRHTMLWR